MGVQVNEFEDGFEIIGPPRINKVNFESYDDHRIAMSFSVLSLLIEEGGSVNNFGCVSISNPNFLDQLRQISC